MVLCAALGIAAGTILSGIILYAWHNQTGDISWRSPCPVACTCDYSWITKGVFVNCSRHDLSQVPADIPKNTVQLDLSYNAIHLLPRFCMELLKLLDLSFNQLGDRGAASLKEHGMENLQELRLVGNKITKIPMGIPPTVTFLDLCNNMITTVSSALICDLPPLRNLILGKNLLNAIKNEGFCPRFGTLPPLSKTLQYLDLSRNLIRTIQDGSFACLEALEYLGLGGNALTVIGFGTFQGLTKLQHLSLCKNSISQISDGAFSEMTDLISLNLAENKLTYVPRHLPPKLELLVISDNAIVVLHEDSTLYRIKHIFVANNPLLCDCHLAWIKNQLIKAAEPDNVKDKCSFPVWVPPDNPKAICELMPRCARPSSVAGKPINEISDEVFECCESHIFGIENSKPTCPLCSKRGRHRNAPTKAPASSWLFSSAKHDCPSLPDDKWVWVTPLDSRRIKVEWTLPAALPDNAVYIHYYMFGHRECMVKVKISVEQKQHILINLRPNTNYIVCVVLEHCPNAHSPVLLDSCLEVRTRPSSFFSRLIRFLLGGTSCCHRNVGVLLLLLILSGLALMAGHTIRKLLQLWKRCTSGKEICREVERTPCAQDTASEKCTNIARTVTQKANPTCASNKRTVNFACTSATNQDKC